MQLWQREELNVPHKQPKRVDYGSLTVPVFRSGLNGAIMYGLGILSLIGTMTAGQLN